MSNLAQPPSGSGTAPVHPTVRRSPPERLSRRCARSARPRWCLPSRTRPTTSWPGSAGTSSPDPGPVWDGWTSRHRGHGTRGGCRPRCGTAGCSSTPASAQRRSPTTSALWTPGRAVPTVVARAPCPARVRGRGQLKGDCRELPRVLPLPLIHPELCRVSPPTSGSNFQVPGAWVGGSMDLRDGAVTMSGRPVGRYGRASHAVSFWDLTIGRTGRPASPCSGGCPHRTSRPGRLRRTRTPSTSG